MSSVKPKAVLIAGGTSDIGREVALRYAESKWRILLAARNIQEAKRNADDINARTGVEVSVHQLDILIMDGLVSFVDALPELPDTFVCVIGELGEQASDQSQVDSSSRVLRTNFEGPALLIGIIAERFLNRGFGTIVGVSSVAGDRGRGSNYIYGSAKAGLTAFLSGLRNRLSSSRVRILTVKPGFVRTRMTMGMKLPPVLTAEAREVGQAIFRAAEEQGKDVIYIRRVWSIIMSIICIIPESIFKKMRL